jgi:hypothetical protein
MLRRRIEADGLSHSFFFMRELNPEYDVNLDIQNWFRHFETSNGAPGATN